MTCEISVSAGQGGKQLHQDVLAFAALEFTLFISFAFCIKGFS